MDYQKTQQWLNKHALTLEESFSVAFRKLAKKHKKHEGYRTLDEVYELIGITKQNVSYWAMNPYNTQTKNFSI